VILRPSPSYSICAAQFVKAVSFFTAAGARCSDASRANHPAHLIGTARLACRRGSVTLITSGWCRHVWVGELSSSSVHGRSRPGQLSPWVEALSLNLPVLGSRDEMAPELEVVADVAEDGQETLRRSGRLEVPHAPLS
jgi:hypothetical protein